MRASVVAIETTDLRERGREIDRGVRVREIEGAAQRGSDLLALALE